MSEEAIKIFYSYSRKDLDLRNALEDHLSALREAKRIETWHDLELEAGTEWEPAILHKLDTADIILLLISSSFIASKYRYGTELKRAIARHDAGTARVIPIILRPCDWNHSYVPFSKLDVLPTHATPITKWEDRDEAFAIVARHIRETVDQLNAKKLADQQRRQLLTQQEEQQRAERERLQREQQRQADALERQYKAALLKQQEAEAAKQGKQELEQPRRRQANRPLTRRLVLQLAIQAGVGVVGVTVARQFLGHQSPQPSPSSTSDTPPIPQPKPSSATPSLVLPVSYSNLEEFLKAGEWRGADDETSYLMSKVANREKEGWLDTESIQNFPCEVLSKIDHLWVTNSDGKFGFSVQKKIYVETCDGKPNGQYYEEAENCFGDRVGWRTKENVWKLYSDVTFNTQAPPGHLPIVRVPILRVWGVGCEVSLVSLRLVNCGR